MKTLLLVAALVFSGCATAHEVPIAPPIPVPVPVPTVVSVEPVSEPPPESNPIAPVSETDVGDPEQLPAVPCCFR